MTVIWLNGPFGGGKTSTAQELTAMLPGSLLYDPEEVGSLLRRLLPQRPHGDFQDIPAWRPLAAATARELLRTGEGNPLIVPMTLLHQSYAHEIFGLLHGSGITVHHVALHTSPDVLRQRIKEHDVFPEDPAHTTRVRQWRLSRMADYQRALPWLRRSAHILDTTTLSPTQVATRICELSIP